MKLQEHSGRAAPAPPAPGGIPPHAAALGLALVLWLAAFPAGAQPRVVYRSLPAPQGERETLPLPADGPVVLERTRYRVEDVERLRIVSPDPEIRVVLRFRGEDGGPGLSVLIVIVDAQPERRDYLYRTDAQVIEGGRLHERRRFRLDEDLVTELQGSVGDGRAGEVRTIVVQDDAAAELRLSRRGDELVLEALSPVFGGRPSGGSRPYWYGRTLAFHDVHLLGAGWTDNGYGELWIAETFGSRAAVFLDVNTTQVLVQGLLKQQLMRWERYAVWIEGGGAYHTLDAPDAPLADQQVVTWVLGGSLHWRLRAWGAAAQLSLVKEDLYLLLHGCWQVFEHMGAVLTWHSFGGFSGYGLGASIHF